MLIAPKSLQGATHLARSSEPQVGLEAFDEHQACRAQGEKFELQAAP
jgi:hypothetical protein